MSKASLFICQSCRAAHDHEDDRPSEGALLFESIQALQREWVDHSDITIQAVRCLWTCDHPCAIALSSPHKSTYLLANIVTTQVTIPAIAAAILHLTQCYLDSEDGNLVWKQFPEVLQTNIVAQIPAMVADEVYQD
jgi:predicted metal-binding protein